MKLYAYFIINGADKKCYRRKVEYDVIQSGNCIELSRQEYAKNGLKYMPMFLMKDDIGKVYPNLKIDVKYAVYLMEDNPEKAMELIKKEIEEEKKELLYNIKIKDKYLNIIDRPVSEMVTDLYKGSDGYDFENEDYDFIY